MKVTAKQLKRLGACRDQYGLFVALGLDGVEITEALCVKYALKFSWYWAAHSLLAKPHWEAYRLAVKPHWEAYRLAVRTHQEAYRLAIKPHWEAYTLAVKPHWEACELATKPHREAYKLELAKAFFAATQQEK